MFPQFNSFDKRSSLFIFILTFSLSVFPQDDALTAPDDEPDNRSAVNINTNKLITQRIDSGKVDESIVTISFTYSADYEKTKKELTRIDELYNSRYNDSEDAGVQTFGLFRPCLTTSCHTEDLARSQQIDLCHKTLENILISYRNYWKSFQAKKQKKDKTEILFRDCMVGLAEWKEHAKNYDADNITGEMDEIIKNISKKSEKCKGYDPQQPYSYAMSDCETFMSELKDARIDIAFWNAIASVRGSQSKGYSDIIELYGIALNKLNTSLAALLGQAKAPAEGYAGADKEAIRSDIKKQWMAAYPNTKILKVKIISSGWKKEVSAIRTDNGNTASAKLFDESKLDIAVIIQDPDSPDIARIYPGILTRDNLNKSSGYFSSCGLYGLGMDYTEMLSKNIK